MLGKVWLQSPVPGHAEHRSFLHPSNTQIVLLENHFSQRIEMTRLQTGDHAPDFSLPDHEGRVFHLAEKLASSNVLLVFNLGFV